MSNAITKDIEYRLLGELVSMFPNAHKRLRVWAETEKYKWKEDESVWNQKKEKVSPQFETHFDREFICFIDGSKIDQGAVDFLTALRALYISRKIFIHEEMYAIEDAKRAEENKLPDLVIPEARNEVEQAIVETVKKKAKKRKRKVTTKWPKT